MFAIVVLEYAGVSALSSPAPRKRVIMSSRRVNQLPVGPRYTTTCITITPNKKSHEVPQRGTSRLFDGSISPGRLNQIYIMMKKPPIGLFYPKLPKFPVLTDDVSHLSILGNEPNPSYFPVLPVEE